MVQFLLRLQPTFVIIMFLIAPFCGFAQIETRADSTQNQDVLQMVSDSLRESLEKNPKQSKFNKFLRKLLTKKPVSKKGDSTTIQYGQLRQDFQNFEGKIIRHINISVLDPFGSSLGDSIEHAHSFLGKFGNFLHIETNKSVIRNYVLQKPGEALDSLKIIETERLIRSEGFIREVVVVAVPVGQDSVDLQVRTIDAWTLVPSIIFNGNYAGVGLKERNFIGLGHDFNTKYKKNLDTKKNVFLFAYSLPNIRKSFIGLNLEYETTERREFNKVIALERKFFSPLTRWAGGIDLSQRALYDSIANPDNQIIEENFRYYLQDFWGGYSFRLFNDEATVGERLNNLVVSARYYNLNFSKHPNHEIDPENFYSDERFYMLGVGTSRWGYVQDRFINNYNFVEDVPVGRLYGITTGIKHKNQKSRLYLGGQYKMGNYFKHGYFGFNVQFGGFFGKRRFEQSVFSLEANYYSRLMTWKRWKFRTFIYSKLIFGGNRDKSYGDHLTFNEDDPSGMRGYNSAAVFGNKKILTHFKFQSYMPYELLGFRLSPFFSSSFGLINQDNKSLLKGRFLAKIGLGLMVTNDYIVFTNIQLSVAWYNSIPTEGHNIIKGNAFSNEDFRVMTYDFDKPRTIHYNPYVVY